MDDGSTVPLLFSILLLIPAFYFALTETAFSSVSRVKLKARADRGESGAIKRTMYVLDNFDRAISTILICTNVVHLAMASLATLFATRKWGLSSAAVATVVVTMIVFFAGEMLPKSIAKKYSERVCLATSALLCFFMHVLSPLSRALTAIGSAAARLTKGDPEVTVTEDELYDIIENMEDDSELDPERGKLVRSALMFADVTAESVLTARVDMAAIDVDAPVEDILKLIKEQKHSRLPVYEKSVDNIIGVLLIRKFMKAYLKHGDAVDVRSLLDMALFAHQSTNIDELLRELSRKKLSMAIVADNYGGTLGIVTVEDILEELVGEIWDEDDIIMESFQVLADGSFEIDAELSVEEAFELIDFEDPDDADFNHKLMGEWAYEQFDLIPSEGDSFRYNGLDITVSGMRNKRIIKLIATVRPEDTENGGEEL